jgi:hypothetical protein
MKTLGPFLTGRFVLTFQFASGLHIVRNAEKETAIPYISDLMSAAALVLATGWQRGPSYRRPSA